MKTDEKKLADLEKELDADLSDRFGTEGIDGDPADADYWFRKPEGGPEQGQKKAVS